MTGSELAQIYEFSYGAIQRNPDGLTHQDSMLSPEPAGNCINWVLGHMVTGRGLVLMLAGAEPSVLTNEEVTCYRRGSTALRDNGNAVDLARLKTALEETQQRLIVTPPVPQRRCIGSRCSPGAAPAAFDGNGGTGAGSSGISRGLSQRTDRLVAAHGGKRSCHQIAITDWPSASAWRA